VGKSERKKNSLPRHSKHYSDRYAKTKNQQHESQFKHILHEKLLFSFAQNAQQNSAERAKHKQKMEMVDMVLFPSFDSACRTW
jgi:hypothetical protein